MSAEGVLSWSGRCKDGPQSMHVDGYVSLPLLFPPTPHAYEAHLAVIERFPVPMILGTDWRNSVGVRFASCLGHVSGSRLKLRESRSGEHLLRWKMKPYGQDSDTPRLCAVSAAMPCPGADHPDMLKHN